jgi:hypothetical protein
MPPIPQFVIELMKVAGTLSASAFVAGGLVIAIINVGIVAHRRRVSVYASVAQDIAPLPPFKSVADEKSEEKVVAQAPNPTQVVVAVVAAPAPAPIPAQAITQPQLVNFPLGDPLAMVLQQWHDQQNAPIETEVFRQAYYQGLDALEAGFMMTVRALFLISESVIMSAYTGPTELQH